MAPAKDLLIFPLDVPNPEEAVRFAGLLKDNVGLFKIGLELFVSSGPAVVEAVKKAAPGAGIFLDLKFHDIPATVKAAMRSAVSLGVDLVTVHTSDRAMLEAAVEGAAGKARVLGVTVLTSLSKEAMEDAGIDPKYKNPTDLVLHRARLARVSGCAGVVCAGLEAGSVKKEFGGDLLVVCPGIRGAEDAVGDQKRVTTAKGAVTDGADYIVVGRPIRNAPDPVRAAGKIAAEVAAALKEKGARPKETRVDEA